MTLYHPELFQRLHSYTLFLDTNVFSAASRSKDFAHFLLELKGSASCAYATIPSVVFEVTQGSSTLDIYNERAQYVKATVDSVVPTSFIDKIQDFCVLMAKVNGGNKSFTDFLLAACLYHYRHSDVYLMTTDQKMFPNFFDRDFVITAEQDSGAIMNFGLHRLNETKYVKALQAILKEA